ncbi:MAG: alkaline phosphatase, partial [Bacteroidales bacterium]|nr:alkaline phosphatase [Bacteroidales bacterium]
MRKLITLAGALLLGAWAFAQTPEDLDRDRSKYATYSFSKDDQYTVETPYKTVSVKQPKGKKVKNIIFLIGDGTGLSQWSVGWVANGGALNIDQMPVCGYSRTWCLDRLVTDSCAGGASLAGGEKTKYGYI